MAIIIGALAIIGLLAIIGVVLLLQGGDRAQATQSTPPPAVATDAPESVHPATPLNGSLPTSAAPEAVNTVPTDSRAPQRETNTEAMNTVPTDGRAPQPETTNEVSVPQYAPSIEHDDEQHVMLNGQFYELVDQLRTLHAQSVEIEQRLNALNQMVEHINQRQTTNT